MGLDGVVCLVVVMFVGAGVVVDVGVDMVISVVVVVSVCRYWWEFEPCFEGLCLGIFLFNCTIVGLGAVVSVGIFFFFFFQLLVLICVVLGDGSILP